MNCHPLIDDEAVEDNTLLTDQDIDIFQGLEEAIEAQEFRENFLTFSRDAPAEPLMWPSSKTFEPLNFSVNKLESSRKFFGRGQSPKTVPTS